MCSIGFFRAGAAGVALVPVVTAPGVARFVVVGVLDAREAIEKAPEPPLLVEQAPATLAAMSAAAQDVVRRKVIPLRALDRGQMRARCVELTRATSCSREARVRARSMVRGPARSRR